MTNGIHRVTANSKAGRRMTSGGGTVQSPSRLWPSEIQRWNAAVEEKKLARAARRSVHRAKGEC